MAATSLIEICDLSKSYKEGDKRRYVFDNLNLTIAGGEFVALLGSSGAGKSTLLNLISGIDLPDCGRIRIGDSIITALSETERTLFRRKHIGFVFQFFNLITTLTVAENLLLPLELNSNKNLATHRQALDLLTRVGLANRQQSFPENLSGGEQQRLAVVRALAHRPRLVLADEPTGNLDVATGLRVLDLLLDLCRQNAATVVMVTHNEAIAARTDRVLRLENGRIEEISQ